MNMSDTMPVRLIANAKLTNRLHITGVRSDGYHLIDAEMVSLDLHDTLVLTRSSVIELSGDDASLSYGSDNLVARALVATHQTARVHIEKAIPAGAGLGGGSSDAAAIFRWANRYDLTLAASLGADIPFCINGGRARVRGIGEVLEPLPFIGSTFTLLLPPFGVSTAQVFRQFDATSAVSGQPEAQNHLFEAALTVEPRLRFWCDRFAAWTGQQPMLAGSGSTLFVHGCWPQPPSHELGDARWIVASAVPPSNSVSA